MNIWEEKGKRLIFFDGGMGTMLQQAGLLAGEEPERWNLTNPEQVLEIHRGYREAGCDVLTANTFGANRLKMERAGFSVREVVEAGVSLARKAAGERCAVALDIGPTGRLLRPLGDLGFEEAYEIFYEMAKSGAAAGADCVIIETMNDAYECKAAVLAARAAAPGLPVFASVIFDSRGKLLTGADIPAVTALLEGLGVDALGVNCGFGPEQTLRLLPELLECVSIPLLLMPNAGLPHSVDGRTVFDLDPEGFAAAMEPIARSGVWYLGGCCGTTPEHLAALIRRCGACRPAALSDKGRTVVSSYGSSVLLGEKPVIIGERINPTGKKRLKQALRENDMDYLLREGLAQQESGAAVLDVNVGMPEIDEKAMMERVVQELQSVTELPLQIDSSDPAVLEAALRLYNGKAMVNSVNGKKESMEAVFPLIQKYGGVVVGLTLDENGIPETAQGRAYIAKKIVDTAAQYGVAKKDILIDALAMTVSTGQDNAGVALETIRRVKKELGVKTCLGVSNISFGLPRRDILNSVFYAMALESGLDAAILNPGAEAMMEVYRGYLALRGLDPGFEGYIGRFGGKEEYRAPAAGAPEAGLGQMIRQGLREGAPAAARALAKTREPLDIINGELIPALDAVGKGFERGEVFLPQLLMSAEAAKAAFEALREGMTGNSGPRGPKVLLATVKGDIHDIGKNIVKVLLQNYRYEVIDLGRDVAPEEVVAAALREDARLVGLSALMTTTVGSMEETIRALRKAAPDCRIMVGGAVLTEDYASQIGADRYVPDAMASVRYAGEILGEPQT
ncbi:MAG: homocysteine S-methyltransferase family protein [Oscillospiraceae bacterium]|nr:homocysteine S-methyltransferase family protein [Oscillospiraceae bacterium]